MMRRPDVIVVGGAKCGTTSFYWYLSKHPDIALPKRKEINFFGSKAKRKYINPSGEEIFVPYYRHYFKNFEKLPKNKKIVEVSPFYLHFSDSASEIKEFFPDSKIIIMLRDPVERLFSHYKHLKMGENKNTKIKIGSLENFVKKGLKKHQKYEKENRLFFNHSFVRGLEYSFYYEPVKRYIDAFGKENVHFVLTQDMKNNLSDTMKRAFNFIGIREDVKTNKKMPVYNKSLYFKNEKIRKFYQRFIIAYDFSRYRFVPQKKAPKIEFLKYYFGKIPGIDLVIQSLRYFFTRISTPLEMSREMEMQLRSFYRDDIEKLENLTGLDLREWVKR